MKRSFEHTDEMPSKMRKVTFDSNIRSSSEKKKTPDTEESMLQTLNQFSTTEESRFEAYKRCTFTNKDAVSNFVAACLIDSNKQSSHHRINYLSLIAGSNDSDCIRDLPPSERAAAAAAPSSSILGGGNCPTSSAYSSPRLSELVAPRSASKITAVVTTLAKINAQRLIQSARSIASAEGYDENQKILPRHLMEAHRIRSKHSGFFMQAPKHPTWISQSCSRLDGNTAVAFGMEDKNKIKLNAALQAQDMYDKIINGLKGDDEEEGEEEDSSSGEEAESEENAKSEGDEEKKEKENKKLDS